MALAGAKNSVSEKIPARKPASVPQSRCLAMPRTTAAASSTIAAMPPAANHHSIPVSTEPRPPRAVKIATSMSPLSTQSAAGALGSGRATRASRLDDDGFPGRRGVVIRPHRHDEPARVGEPLRDHRHRCRHTEGTIDDVEG